MRAADKTDSPGNRPLCPRTAGSIPVTEPGRHPDDLAIGRSDEVDLVAARLASVTMRVPDKPVTARSAAISTRSALITLTATLGTAGLAAAAANPGLLAVVDQHAAAVRDSLGGDRRALTVAALAGYAEGIRGAAVEHGWQSPAAPVDWSQPDWPLTRLLAVCALARSLDPRHLA